MDKTMTEDLSGNPSGTPSKKEQLAELAEELLQPPEEHYIARCQECERVVERCPETRLEGMARVCEDHRPLCELIHHD